MRMTLLIGQILSGTLRVSRKYWLYAFNRHGNKRKPVSGEKGDMCVDLHGEPCTRIPTLPLVIGFEPKSH